MAAQSPAKLFSARPAKLFTIGQVLSLLQPDFPELSSSKLRFLEEQGLVTPQRTASNYRKFTENDVERIRAILDLQRTQYLPLKVIESILDDLDAGKQPSLPNSAAATPVFHKLHARRLTQLELVSETGITDSQIAEAQEQKLLGDAPFDLAAVEIAHALVNLKRYGIAPRHLRGLKASVDREIGIIEGVVAPVLGRKETASRAQAAHHAREMEQQFAQIRSSLINAAIRSIEN